MQAGIFFFFFFFAGGSSILNSNRHVWQWKEEGMLCEIHKCDLKFHFQQDFLAYCTKPVSEHLAMACVNVVRNSQVRLKISLPTRFLSLLH